LMQKEHRRVPLRQERRDETVTAHTFFLGVWICDKESRHISRSCVLCTPEKILFGWSNKKNEMGTSRGMHGAPEVHTGHWLGACTDCSPRHWLKVCGHPRYPLGGSEMRPRASVGALGKRKLLPLTVKNHKFAAVLP
jgi:hypothetical protein